MRQIRLHVDLPLAADSEIDLPAAPAAHALRVLRLKSGSPVVLFNGDGFDYAATLVDTTRDTARARIDSRRAACAAAPFPIVLAQALARGDKMDLVIQKAVELGANVIVPLVTERSEVRLDGARAEKRLAHWRAVIVAASEQSGRARVATITPPQTLANWCASLAGDASLRLALLPGGGTRVRDLVVPATGANLAIGPEGGFGERDEATLKTAGFVALGLGPRILRTETAGLAALAALQAIHGDL